MLNTIASGILYWTLTVTGWTQVQQCVFSVTFNSTESGIFFHRSLPFPERPWKIAENLQPPKPLNKPSPFVVNTPSRGLFLVPQGKDICTMTYENDCTMSYFHCMAVTHIIPEDEVIENGYYDEEEKRWHVSTAHYKYWSPTTKIWFKEQ